MGIIIGFLIGILVLCALLLVIIILIQDDGSEGAGIIFGSAASQQYGVRKGNIVTRTTGILATVFMALAFVLAFFLTDSDDASSLQKIAEQKQSTNTTIKWWEESESSDRDEREAEPASENKAEDVVSDVSPVHESDAEDDENNSRTSSSEPHAE